MQFPFVSVILPIRNESIAIKHSLLAILEQDYPKSNFEVLVVDGMSIDDTRQIVNKIRQNTEIHVVILDNLGKIVPKAMNLGLNHAKGEIIVRVDGHTVIAPDYIRQCLDALERTGADNVGGIMNAIGTTPFARAVALATSSPFGVGGARFHYSDQEEWVDTVYMGAWPRTVFGAIGLFDEELVRDQDDELNYRLRSAGGKILLDPKIKSKYTVRSSPHALWRQYFQYGFWKVRVLQKHPRQMSLRQFVPPVFVLALLISLLSMRSPVPLSLSLLVPIIYLLANLGTSISTASKHGWHYLPLLPITFAILHLSYGSGFLVGLFKFWNRWGDKIGKVPTVN